MAWLLNYRTSQVLDYTGVTLLFHFVTDFGPFGRTEALRRTSQDDSPTSCPYALLQEKGLDQPLQIKFTSSDCHPVLSRSEQTMSAALSRAPFASLSTGLFRFMVRVL